MSSHIYVVLLCMFFAGYSAIISAGPFAYIASPTEVIVVDVATNTVIKTIAVPGSSNLYSIALTPDNQYAYVADNNLTKVFAINLTTDAVSSIDTSGIDADPAFFIAIAPDGSAAYVTFDSEEHLAKISIPDNTVTGYTLEAPAFYAYVLAIAPNGETIYLSGDDETPGTQVSTFSILTQAQGGIGGVGDTGYIPGLAVTSDSNTLYACCAGSPTSELVPITNLLTSPSVQPGILLPYPYAVALSPDNKTGYVINFFTNPDNFSVINLATATVTATLTVGDDPQFLAVTGDGNYVYTTNATSTVSVVNTKSNTVTSFDLDPTANGIAIATTPPPTDVVGMYKYNIFLDKTELVLQITWTASADTMVTSYNIYNGTTFVASIPATSSLSYNALLLNSDTGNNFAVTAVSAAGGESVPALISIQS